jgi:uncharacterized protein (TIGR03083 family)
MEPGTEPTRDQALDALQDAYQDVTELVAGLDEHELLQPSRCQGWAVRDLLFHMLLDAQRALVTLATPATGPPDVDFVTYWLPFKPGMPGADAHQRFVAAAAGAYSRPQGLVAHWSETSEAALRAAAAAPADGCFATQGHVLTLPSFLATLIVEAAVHHLDLVGHLPGRPGPGARPLRLVRSTLDGLLGEAPATGWDDETYALVGTGRLPLGDADRAALGPLADRFPVFG